MNPASDSCGVISTQPRGMSKLNSSAGAGSAPVRSENEQGQLLKLRRTDDSAALAINAEFLQLTTPSGANHPGFAAETTETNGCLASTAMSIAAKQVRTTALEAAVSHIFFTTSAVLAGPGAASAVAEYFTVTALGHCRRLPESFRPQAKRRHHRAPHGSTEHAQHLTPGKLAGDHSRYVIE